MNKNTVTRIGIGVAGVGAGRPGKRKGKAKRKILVIALTAASILGGCTTEQLARATASGHRFHDTVVVPLLEGAGNFATGYAESYDSEPHGTMQATSIQFYPGGPVTTTINY